MRLEGARCRYDVAETRWTQPRAQLNACSHVQNTRVKHQDTRLAALDRNQTLIAVGLADRLNLLDRIQFVFGGVELYGKSLSVRA